MATIDSLIAFAAAVRADRAANPQVAGDGTALELLIAPRFQALVEAVLPQLTAAPPRVLPEYRVGGFERPDIAFAQPGALARAFIELKEPRKEIEPAALRGHDADQFARFSELPVWALTNFISIRLFERGRLVDQAAIVPRATLDPDTAAAEAERLIRADAPAGLERIVQTLAMAQPRAPRDAQEIAEVLAHAARLVRGVVFAQAREGLDAVVEDVRAEFNETLFARAEAGGYDPRDMNALFSSAFAQTLVFGLLLAREAGGVEEVGHDAYTLLPDATYPLLRGTLRALTLDEVRAMLGAAFDVTLDAVNSVDPGLLAPRNGRDPVLYLYENFLRVFDPEAVAKYGVYYTPPEIVQLIVAETDRALRDGLGCDGLLDPDVRLLDPGCGTGTFLIGATSAAAQSAAARYGEGMVGAQVSAFAQRMFGFELLVGPYTVAHYRVLREIAGRGGGVRHVPIYLTDTLAPPAGAEGVVPHLAFMGAPMVAERQRADEVKRDVPILAIIGNPPYKRLRSGEVERLVGPDMDRRWEDLKQPVRAAGLGRSLNAFPDLYVAFYRWALWRLFEADGAQGRGVLGFITNRNFLTGSGFGGLRKMLRTRFDEIRIIDFRGDSRSALPATVPNDANVFNIEVGVCVLIAYATGEKEESSQARVLYADVWQERAFTRREKLEFAEAVAADAGRLAFRGVETSGMGPLKPPGFWSKDWPSLRELFLFRSNGIVTYRDAFAYATTVSRMEERIRDWLALPALEAAREFKETRDRKAAPALAVPFRQAAIEPISYRPLDIRYLYNTREYIDFPKPDLQSAWGQHNVALFALNDGTGEGPAVWSHGFKPDQHAFSNRGGWVFPLWNRSPEGAGHFLAPGVLARLASAHGNGIEPQDVFDAVLALLSASSYTTRFAHDLEDDFPHVPFPSDSALFDEAARIGARIRALQGFQAEPHPDFRHARLEGQPSGPSLDVPTPAKAYQSDGCVGSVALLPDRSLRMVNVGERIWSFNVSGYQLLYRWLRARQGEELSGESGVALLRGALDIAWRIDELLSLMDEADAVLAKCLEDTLTRDEIGLPPREEAPASGGEEDAPA